MKPAPFALSLAAAVAVAVPAAAVDVNLTPIGTYTTGVFDESAAEIPAYHAASSSLFVSNSFTNAIDVIDISNPFAPTSSQSIDLTSFGGGPNSVAIFGNTVAVAVENNTVTDNGTVQFFDANTLASLGSVGVGALPDMLTFTPDGARLLVANEGEPNDDYTIDPEGSVSIIDVNYGNLSSSTVNTADFTAFNGAILESSVRVFGPGATAAEDFEPEYVSVSLDGTTAYVSLQENNALAIVDIATAAVTSIEGLGFKDHSLPGNGLDANKNDDAAVIENLPIFGMYQPDAIATYEVAGQTYVVTANEGDGREYEGTPGFVGEADLKDVTLDAGVFDPAFIARAGDTDDIGDLTITNTLGDTDNDGEFEEIYAYGGRSFSIYDAAGNQVFDSGDQFEQLIAAVLPDHFNASNDDNSIDDRSDNKGPEPEGLVIAEIGDTPVAFIGLERVGGVLAFDLTDPTDPQFLDYVNNRDFDADVETLAAGDLGPEGLLFIDAADSPIGEPLLVVTNEVSGSTTIYSIPEPTTLATLGLGLLGLAARRRLA